MGKSIGWPNGSTRKYRETRAFVLERDGYRCRLQFEGICTTVATDAHHTGPREVTGDDPEKMIAACHPCNVKAGDPRKGPDPAPRGRTQW